MGQASPQPIVITTSAALTNSSLRGLGNSWLMSIPISRIASTTTGWSSCAGVLPAERTCTLPLARSLRSPAAIWLRPALCTQTKSTSGTSFPSSILDPYNVRTWPVREWGMALVHFRLETKLAPGAVLAALTDFGPRRSQIWPNIDDQHFKLHSDGPGWAEVTEG